MRQGWLTVGSVAIAAPAEIKTPAKAATTTRDGLFDMRVSSERRA